MVSEIALFLQKEMLSTDAIILEGPDYDDIPQSDIEGYDNAGPVMISVNRDTGDPVVIVLEGFTADIDDAIQSLRDDPLPWTFTLDSLGIRGKPLEDVLLAVWKKYKNITMEWDEE